MKKPKRGRPPLNPADARSETLRVRLTPGELGRLQGAAKAQGESISDYARWKLLDVTQKSAKISR